MTLNYFKSLPSYDDLKSPSATNKKKHPVKSLPKPDDLYAQLDAFDNKYRGPTAGEVVGDIGKTLASGATQGVGTMFRGGGELLAGGINKVGEALGYDPQLRAIDPLEDVTKSIDETVSEPGKRALADSTPSGELLKPETWSAGDDPSAHGYALQTAKGVGQFLPMIAGGLALKGAKTATQLAYGAGTGGLQGIGAGAEEQGQWVKDQDDEQLYNNSTFYKELVDKGISPQEARASTQRQAELGGSIGQGLMAALPGALEQAIIGAIFKGKRLPIKNKLAAAGVGGAGGATFEGLQEAGEGAAGRYGSNVMTGGNQELGEGTFGEFVMGALPGGAMGVVGGALPDTTKRNPDDIPVMDDQGNQIGWRDQISGETYAPIQMDNTNLPKSQLSPEGKQPTLPQPKDMGHAPVQVQAATMGGQGFEQQVTPRTPDQATGVLDKALLTAGIDAQADNTGFTQNTEQPQGQVNEVNEIDKPAQNQISGELETAPGPSVEIQPNENPINQTEPKEVEVNEQQAQTEATQTPTGEAPGTQASTETTTEPSSQVKQGDRVSFATTQGDPVNGEVVEMANDKVAKVKLDHNGKTVRKQVKLLNKVSEESGNAPDTTTTQETRTKTPEETGTTAKPEGETRETTQPAGEVYIEQRYRNITDIDELAKKGIEDGLIDESYVDVFKMSSGGDVNLARAGLDTLLRMKGKNPESFKPRKGAKFSSLAEPTGEAKTIIEDNKKHSYISGRFGKNNVDWGKTPKPYDTVHLKNGEVYQADIKDGELNYVKGEAKPNIETAANEAALSPNNDLPEPTQAQKEAGNYKKAHIKVQGMDVSIENPKDSERKGTDNSGKEWSVKMNDHYGYFKGTTGYDKDHLDVFMGPAAEDTKSVYVVDQIHPDTGKFDEHKVMMGYESEQQAKEAYQSNYDKNWKGLSAITEMPMEEFKQWAYSNKPKKGALKKTENVKAKIEQETMGKLASSSLTAINVAQNLEKEKSKVKQDSESDQGSEISQEPTGPRVQISYFKNARGYDRISITGDTKAIKDEIKAIGGAFWSRKEKAWTFAKGREANVRKALSQYLDDGKTTEPKNKAEVDQEQKETYVQAAKRIGIETAKSINNWQEKESGIAKVKVAILDHLWANSPEHLSEKDINAVAGNVYKMVVSDLAVEKVKSNSKKESKKTDSESNNERKLLGKNPEGKNVYVDENGARSYEEDGLLVGQSVSIIPGTGISFDNIAGLYEDGKTEFLTAEEVDNYDSKQKSSTSTKDQQADAPKSSKNDGKAKSKEQIKAENDFDKDLAAMGDFLLNLNSMKVVPDGQRETFTRLLTNLMGSAFKLGYVKFKDNAKYILDTVSNKFGKEAAENFDLQSLQGSYIAMSSGRADVTPMVDVVQTTMDDIKTQADKIQESSTTNKKSNLIDDFYQAIKEDNAPKNLSEFRKWVNNRGLDGQNSIDIKKAQEYFEAAQVRVAREIAGAGKPRKQTYDELLDLYQRQPILHAATSTSVMNQAFSTPAPIAYIASELAGINKNTVVYEPTAGNGMLLINADQQKATVNELEDLRAENLKANGFNVTKNDAAVYQPKKKHDAMIANPPFGNLGRGNEVRVDGYKIREIDHLIASKALETIKDDGRATIIIGANKHEGKVRVNDKIFFNWLYSNYNVINHFEINGDLYRRQGSGWPIAVISVNGRAKSQNISPQDGEVKRYDNWEQIFEHSNEVVDSIKRGGSISTGGTGSKNTQTSANAGTQSVPGSVELQSSGSNQSESGRGQQSSVSGGRRTTRNGSRSESGSYNSDRLEAGENEATGAYTGAVDSPQPNDGGRASGQPERKSTSVNKLQTEYTSESNGFNEAILTPTGLSEATQASLKQLKSRVGDLDAYVQNELGYKSKEALHKAFMGLQVDGVALAIDSIRNNKGMIIADQTGVGKGRQAAAVIRWARKNGMTPIFVSEKPNLFTDMYDDLADIDSHDIKPFILNSNASINQTDDSGNVTKLFGNPNSVQHNKAINGIVTTGKLPEDRNALFMTYSQINKPGNKRNMVEAMSRNNSIFILDESHNAGGQSNTGKFISDSIGNVQGVLYLSATYAKRPDNMPLYYRTDLGEATEDRTALVDAIERGGVLMQTVVSNQLAQSGQMVRRERSFEGIEIKSVTIGGNDKAKTKEQEDLSDRFTEVLRSITSADKLFHTTFVDYMKNQVGDGKDAFYVPGTDVSSTNVQSVAKGVDHTNFSSVVHNKIKQLLFVAKADEAADLAIKAIENNQKPVIALDDTLGSFLEEYVESNGLTEGDSLADLSFKNILQTALDRSRRLRVTLPTGDKMAVEIPYSELDEITRHAYDQAEEMIKNIDVEGLPVSPIDHIKNKIRQKGYSVKEITGRKSAINYENLSLDKIKESGQGNRRNTVDEFNNGDLDVVILNRAGSTGLSLHSSEKFKDQRQRHMVVAQPSLDINVFMQMLGRVNRTGQQTPPLYSLLALNIPSEIRPNAILSKKMKSLNANTSSDTKSNTSIDSVDIINKYGDEVVAEYLKENPELRSKLNVSLDDGSVSQKSTGRLATLSVQEQKDFYADVEQQYNEYIAHLDKIGRNDLEKKIVDLQAEILDTDILYPGTNHKSLFGGDVIIGHYNVQKQGYAPLPNEVVDEINKFSNGRSSKDIAMKIIEQKDKQSRDFLKRIDSVNDEDSKRSQQDHFDRTKRDLESHLNTFAVGNIVNLTFEGETMKGVVTGVKNTHKDKTGGNPFAHSKTIVRFAVDNAYRTISFPISKLTGDKSAYSSRDWQSSITEIFEKAKDNSTTEKRFIVTGNLLQGITKVPAGNILQFTKKDGTSEIGIILPKEYTFQPSESLWPVKDAKIVMKMIKDDKLIQTQLIDSSITANSDGGISIFAGKSKGRAKHVITDEPLLGLVKGGEFSKVGSGQWSANVSARNATKALTRFMSLSPIQVKRTTAEEYGLLNRAKYSKANGSAGQTKQELDAELKRQFGPRLKNIVTLDKQDELPGHLLNNQDATKWALDGNDEMIAGAYDAPTNTIYLVAENIPKEDTKGLLMHEVVHGVLYDSPAYQDALAALERTKGSKLYQQAEQAAIDAGTPQEDMQEEILAYYIQNRKNLPMVRRLINKLRQWLRSTFGWTKVSMDEVYEMVEAMAKADPKAEFVLNDGRVMGMSQNQARESAKNKTDDNLTKELEELADAIETGETAINYQSVAEKVSETLFRDATADTKKRVAKSFQNWFGHSKAIEPDGYPVTFYYRGNRPFKEIFKQEELGGNTRDALAGIGFFSATQPEETFGPYETKLFARAESPYFIESKEALAEELAKKGYPNTFAGHTYFKNEVLKPLGFDSIYFEHNDWLAVFDPNQYKDADNNTGDFSRDDNRVRFSKRKASSPKTSEQSFLDKINPNNKPSVKEKYKEFKENLSSKIRQGLVDRYDALFELDKQAYGADVVKENTNLSSWVLAKMSSASEGAVHAMLDYGRIKMDKDGAIDVREKSKSLINVLHQLGNGEEINRFMGWMAANRADTLMQEGRENLFTPEEIQAGKKLNQGKEKLYNKVYREFNQFQRDVLEISKQSGIISEQQAEDFASEMYVPFYRVMSDEDVANHPIPGNKLSRQQAYKKLKGGNQPLNDLLENTLINFNHLIAASLKNNAASQAVSNAKKVKVAKKVSDKFRDKKSSTFILENGNKVWYNIDDPLVFNALTSLTDLGMNQGLMKVMRKFKRIFTSFTTASPQFIIANLLRDSIQAAALGKMSAKSNVASGILKFNDKNKVKHRMIASGGAFSFGHIYMDDPDAIRQSVDRELMKGGIIRKPKDVSYVIKKGWDKYQSISNRAENANRAAIYEQAINDGKSHLQAAFEARDLLDFSSRGEWAAIRVLTDIVPFLNARLQGLDVLHRKGLQPAIKTAFGKGTKSDKIIAARFSAVTGAVMLASMALFMAYKDDEDFKEREDWDRDTYWWFKIGDSAFKIPKPFEIGAIGTMSERILEQFVDDKATGKLFAERFGEMLWNTFAFNPTPQMIKPAYDIYSNRDSFTGRQIESMGMSRLSPSRRARANTTSLAKNASKALESTFGELLGKESSLVLSPVQIDYLIQNYLGWVGASANGIVDGMVNWGERPSKYWHEYQPIRRFYQELPSQYSKYATQFYDNMAEVNRVYSDINNYKKLGEFEKARELFNENRGKLHYRRWMNRVQKRLTNINSRMKRIRNGALTQEEKRRRIDALQSQKKRLTKIAAIKVPG